MNKSVIPVSAAYHAGPDAEDGALDPVTTGATLPGREAAAPGTPAGPLPPVESESESRRRRMW